MKPSHWFTAFEMALRPPLRDHLRGESADNLVGDLLFDDQLVLGIDRDLNLFEQAVQRFPWHRCLRHIGTHPCGTTASCGTTGAGSRRPTNLRGEYSASSTGGRRSVYSQCPGWHGRRLAHRPRGVARADASAPFVRTPFMQAVGRAERVAES